MSAPPQRGRGRTAFRRTAAREPSLPSLPFGPGREPLSHAARRGLALALAAFVVVTVAVGAAILSRPGGSKLRVVTIPLGDRAASPALLRAAELVGFEPASEPGSGSVEGEPLATPAPPSARSLLAPGVAAPDFRLATPTGARVSLSALRGKAVLLEFFATWCPHCAAEAPHLERLARSLAGGRFALVAVDADGETAPSVLAFHIYFGLSYPALLDPSAHPGSFHAAGAPGGATRSYRVAVFPTFYVLDRSGRVAWAGEGEQPDALLRAELRRAAALG